MIINSSYLIRMVRLNSTRRSLVMKCVYLRSPSDGFNNDLEYGWTLYIHHPDGAFGFIYYYYPIGFADAKSLAHNFSSISPQPNRIDLDKLLNRQFVP